MASSLCIHSGARPVSYEELATIEAPEPTATWFPIPHATVLDAVVDTLTAADYRVERLQLAVGRDDARFFATLDLRTTIGDGVALSVGVRNSIDKSLPIGFCAGSRVFVCDNLAFRSELLVTRKHTRFGDRRFREAISHAVVDLDSFRRGEGERIAQMRATPLDDVLAESFILRAYERDIISSRVLPDVLREWREPAHEEFRPRTAWSLFNAFTEGLKGVGRSNPQQFAEKTLRLNGMILPSIY